MNDTTLLLAIGAGSLAGILYGQQLSEQLLARILGRTARRMREVRCVLCCGRIGSLLTALPTFFLTFLLPGRIGLAEHNWAQLLQSTGLIGIGVLTAVLLTASLPLGAALGALTGRGIAGFTRDAHPADRPA